MATGGEDRSCLSLWQLAASIPVLGRNPLPFGHGEGLLCPAKQQQVTSVGVLASPGPCAITQLLEQLSWRCCAQAGLRNPCCNHAFRCSHHFQWITLAQTELQLLAVFMYSTLSSRRPGYSKACTEFVKCQAGCREEKWLCFDASSLY